MLRSEQKFRPCIPIVTHLSIFEHKSNQLFRFLQYLLLSESFVLLLHGRCSVTVWALQYYCISLAVPLQPGLQWVDCVRWVEYERPILRRRPAEG